MSTEMMKEAVEFMEQMQTPFYAWFVGALVLVIDHPDDAYTVLNSKSCMEKAFVYRFFNMGASLFTAPGALIPILTFDNNKYFFYLPFLLTRKLKK